LNILSEAEIESRYHVKLERYIKDIFIEMYSMREMTDTLVLPAAFSYSASLLDAAGKARAAGIRAIPQLAAASAVNKAIVDLQKGRAALDKAITKAESMHESLEKCAAFLTKDGADAMASVHAAADALELMVDDDCWPLPKYREMLFPV
jgi:glutamine synthetase